MPSTRISICVICARVSGTAKEPNRASRARYFRFIAPPSSKVQPKLLGNSKTNVAANGHKQCTSLLNSPDLRFVARDGIRASKDGRAGGLRGLLGTKLRWDQRQDSFTQGSARNAGGS